GELRDLAPPCADPTGVFYHRRRSKLPLEVRKPFLQRSFAKLRRVGVELPQLLNLLLDALTRLRCDSLALLGMHRRDLLSSGGVRGHNSSPLGIPLCSGHEHGAADQASVLEIVVRLLRRAYRIAVDQDFEPAERGQLDDVHQRDAAAVEARPEL